MGNGLVSFDVFLYLCHLSYFPSYLFVLQGEPSRFPGDGNHSPDLRGHLWTHICHGWEPRISHKGWSALPHSSVVVASAESYSVQKIKMLRRWWRRWDGPNVRLSFFEALKFQSSPAGPIPEAAESSSSNAGVGHVYRRISSSVYQVSWFNTSAIIEDKNKDTLLTMSWGWPEQHRWQPLHHIFSVTPPLLHQHLFVSTLRSPTLKSTWTKSGTC